NAKRRDIEDTLATGPSSLTSGLTSVINLRRCRQRYNPAHSPAIAGTLNEGGNASKDAFNRSLADIRPRKLLRLAIISKFGRSWTTMTCCARARDQRY